MDEAGEGAIQSGEEILADETPPLAVLSSAVCFPLPIHELTMGAIRAR
jgi:hypothetical protein